jgi:hypothetical protein
MPARADQLANTPLPWWKNPSGLLSQLGDSDRDFCSCDWYRIVDAFVGIDSEDIGLRMTFQELLGECLSDSPPAPENSSWLHCSVRASDRAPANVVTFTAPEEVNVIDFTLALFRDRGYIEMQRDQVDWRSLGLAGRTQPFLIAKGASVLVDARETWQPLIASCAVTWAMTMQREMLFFHAAAVGIDGDGVLITGAKAAGKSTLSTALAAGGHAFLGDEIAAVRPRTMVLESFRRAISIRPGPRDPKVEQLLAGKVWPNERFPDGTTRTRALPAELFPEPRARSLPLRWIFFLCGREDNPRAEAFVPRATDLRILAPLACSFWGRSPALPMMQVAKLLSNVNCYRLYPGSPEKTARLVERIVTDVRKR